MIDPTTPTERRELRERAEAAHGDGLCAGLLHVDPKRLLALLAEHEEQAKEIERLRQALAVSERDTNALMERLSEPAPSDKAAAERSVCVEQESGGKAVSLQSTPDNFIVLARGLGEHEADIIAGSMQNILEGILSDHVAQLRAEQAADRAAVRAMVERLPRCEGCHGAGASRPSTAGINGHVESDRPDNAHGSCDEHADRGEGEEDEDGFPYDADLPWAVPLRALQDRMATWPEAVPVEASGRAADGPGAGPLDSVLSEASRRVAAWPEYMRSDDVKRRQREFDERLARLAATAETSEAPALGPVEWMGQERAAERDDLPGPDDAPDSATNHRWGHLPGCLWDGAARSWGCVPGCPGMEPPTHREPSSRPVQYVTEQDLAAGFVPPIGVPGYLDAAMKRATAQIEQGMQAVADAGRRTLDRMRAVSAVWAEAEVPAVPPEPDGDEESAYDVGAGR